MFLYSSECFFHSSECFFHSSECFFYSIECVFILVSVYLLSWLCNANTKRHESKQSVSMKLSSGRETTWHNKVVCGHATHKHSAKQLI